MVVPETAVEYTLYGDSVYVIRHDGKDAKGSPILKDDAHAGQDRSALGRQGGDPQRAQARRTGRRRRAGKNPERRAGRGDRLAGATDPGAPERALSPHLATAGALSRW